MFNNIKFQIADFLCHTLVPNLFFIATKLTKNIPELKGQVIFDPGGMFIMKWKDPHTTLEILENFTKAKKDILLQNSIHSGLEFSKPPKF